MRRGIAMLVWLAVLCVIASAGITYTYDTAGRVATADYGNGSVITYTYDAAGNLISRTASNSLLAAPVLNSPANGALGLSTSTGLSWSASAGATSYDVYFGTSNPPPMVTNVAGTTYTPATLAAATEYFWMIVAKNASATSGSSVWSFTTLGAGAQPISVSPLAGTAGRQVFTFLARDSAGASSIQYVQFLFSKSGLSALNGCYVSYDPTANVFYLLSDDMTQWYGLLGGSGNTVGNAQCTIYGATSGSAKSGTDLTTHIDISLRPEFAGTKNIYQFAGGTTGDTSGWIQMTTWNDTGDPNAVQVTSLTPNSGTGASQTFTALVQKTNPTTISFSELVITGQPINSFSGNGCFIFYAAAANVFFLLNDAATEFSGLVAGSAGSVSNSQCTLTGTGSGGTTAGSNLTVTFNLSFKPAFTGTKQVYMQAADDSGVIEVWHQTGTWVP